MSFDTLSRLADPSTGKALLEVASALARAYSQDEIARIIVGEAADVSGAAVASAYFLVSPETLGLAAVRGTDALQREIPLAAEFPLPECVRTGEPTFIETYDELVRRYPRLLATPSAVPAAKKQSVACLPLRAGDEVVGGLAFGFEQAHRFDDEERAMLLALGKHASIAIERARLRASDEAARHRLEVLARASRHFSESTLDLTTAVEAVAREIATSLGCSCAVNVLDARGEALLPVAIHDPDPARLASVIATMDRAPVRLDEASSLARVAKTGQAVFLPNVDMSAVIAATPRAEYRSHLERFPIRSLAVIPLRAHGAVVGVLTASTPADALPMTGDVQSMLVDLADRAACAIQSARFQDDARRAVQGREELLAVVSHDLRNPLAALSMSIELVARRLRDEPGGSTRAIGAMRRAVDRMRNLITNLLDVAILDAGQMSLKLEPVNVRALIEDSIAVHEPLAVESGCTLAAAVPPGTGTVRADRERLLQVFANLIGNAIKFTPTGGRITIGAERNGSHIMLSVGDTGQGIAADDLPHIFDRYWRVREARRDGVGLGLSIVQGIVAAHGGKIWVESEPGSGTTFRFSLPAA